MAASWIPTLVLVAGIAVLAPILGEFSGKLGIPAMVIELVLGVVVGPDVLKLAHTGSVVSAFSDMGLAFLMFLAGYELDLMRIRGRPLRLATASWVSSAVVAVAFSLAVVATGLEHDPLVFGLTLTTTALGTVLPLIRDAGVLETEFGQHVMAAGTIGEFGPIVAVSVFLTQRHPAITILLLVVFLATAVAAALLATRTQQPRVVAMLGRHLHSSSQLPIRVSILLIFLLVYLASTLGLDVLLGAVAAGIVVRLFTEGDDSPVIRGKLEAIGFGFLIPIFFVVSGVTFDLHSLLHNPSAALRIPLYLLLLLVVRGAPSLWVYRKQLPRPQRLALALFSVTGLPLIVVIAEIGVAADKMAPENAAALIAAGVLSVLIFPIVGLRLLPRGTPAASAGPVDPPSPPSATGSSGPPHEDPFGRG
ncbi:MAG TPA: cation:proton antiporter [Acidimicrobiales bacterium]|jgi:Kef-type K+ transport system membrane component KefB|nr:cation:proton antiporter [Acidimicrobiales bacterium]